MTGCPRTTEDSLFVVLGYRDYFLAEHMKNMDFVYLFIFPHLYLLKRYQNIHCILKSKYLVIKSVLCCPLFEHVLFFKAVQKIYFWYKGSKRLGNTELCMYVRMYRFISLKHVYTFMNEKRDENELFQMGNDILGSC